MQKFSGVVRWLQGEGNFIYVLNGDGMWVVSQPIASLKPSPRFPMAIEEYRREPEQDC